MIRTVVFDSKPYDRESLEGANGRPFLEGTVVKQIKIWADEDG